MEITEEQFPLYALLVSLGRPGVAAAIRDFRAAQSGSEEARYGFAMGMQTVAAQPGIENKIPGLTRSIIEKTLRSCLAVFEEAASRGHAAAAFMVDDFKARRLVTPNMPEIGPEVGDVMPQGDAHAGYSYAGEDQKGKLWVAFAPTRMDHQAATDWAQAQGGGLPTRKEGDYLDSVKGKLSQLFNLSGSFPAGYVWLEEPAARTQNLAWSQDLSDGDQTVASRDDELPVLCVRR